MENTVNLSLPYIMPSQAQKHVTHNEALRLLDALIQLTVRSRTQASPPGSPVEGERHIVPSGASGVWSGWDGDIALFADGGWLRLAARLGWRAWVEDEGLLVILSGSSWTAIEGGGGGAEAEFDGIGVRTSPDAANRLAVKSDAVLFSHDDQTPGSGNMQLKINKSAVGQDAALLFQNDWSARALIGLLGDDDFHFKVSSDGDTFQDAITIDSETGRVSINEPSFHTSALNIRGKSLPGVGGGIYALTISSSRNNNSNTGGAFSNAAYNNSHKPFLIFSSLAQQTSSRIYWGGGGWALPSVTDQRFFSGTHQPDTDDASTLAFHIDATANLTHRNLVPGADNTYSLGTSSRRYSVVYATTGTINTSDARLKQDITPVPLGLDFVRELEPVSYRWKTGGHDIAAEMQDDPEQKVPGGKVAVDVLTPRSGARTHFGLVAQQVKAALDAHGIADFAGWTLADKDDPDSEQGLRYDQFVPILIKAVQDLSKKVETLEAEIKALR